MYEVTFNDKKLNDFCKILKIDRSILPKRTNNNKKIPCMNGSAYTGFSYGERIIKIDIMFDSFNPENYMKKVRDLGVFLNVNEPKKLIISDEPDKYVYAVLDGDTPLKKLTKTGSTTLTFVCYNPTIYSDAWQTFTPDNRGVTTITNLCNYNTFPFIDVIFQKDACFFQATNQDGETVLIGKPKELDKATIKDNNIIINDNCQDNSVFTTMSNSLLPNGYKSDDANFGIGFNGDGVVCTNYGSGDKWHGASFRRSLGQDVSEFEVAIDVVFSAQGKNYEPPKPAPIPPKAPQRDTIPKDQKTSLGTYKVVNCGGLWINREPNTRHPMHAMSPGELIYPVEIKGKWFKHTKKYWHGTYTGWSYGRYLKKVSNNGAKRQFIALSSWVNQNYGTVLASTETNPNTPNPEFAESQVGTLQIMGFDRNGSQLFVEELTDGSEWFEATNPTVKIGGKTILSEDAIRNRSVRQVKVDKDYENSASGAVGRWNDLTGKFIIRRQKNNRGQFFWNVTLNKYNNGKLIESLTTKNDLCDGAFPTGSLNYLGFFIGTYGNNLPLSVATITNISVKSLNLPLDNNVDSNVSLFNADDHLQIDFETGLVTCNGEDITDNLDIGSRFFEVPTGTSFIVTRSDDNTMTVCTGIQNRYI